MLYADVKSSTPLTGQVRFDSAEDAQAVMENLSGAVLDGHKIAMKMHAGSKDGTKLQIFNLPPTIEWQDLKDFFAGHGYQPAFVATSPAGGSATAEA